MAKEKAPLYAEIDAAEAIKALGKKLDGVTVQVAKPLKKKGDDGKVRETFEVKTAALQAAHVISAKKWADGKVSITTIDGRRYDDRG